MANKLNKICDYSSKNNVSFDFKSDFLINETFDIYFNNKMKILNTKLFRILGNKYFIEKKYELAEKYYIFGLNNNDKTCMLSLAILYSERNNIVILNDDIKINYYKCSLEEGKKDSAYQLGLLYERNIERDTSAFASAIKYYMLAVENNNIEALYRLCVIYKKTNPEKSYEYLSLYKQKKSNSDLIEKQLLELALICGKKYYMEEKYDLAEKYYLLITEKDCETLFRLGYIYYYQGKYDLAEKYYMLNIDKHCKDTADSHDYYNKAYDNYCNLSMNNISVLYHKQKKYDLFEKQCKRSIEFLCNFINFPICPRDQTSTHIKYLCKHLGYYYCDKNTTIAEKYYLIAIKYKDAEAMKNLAQLYQFQKKYLLAKKYYLMAIDNNDNQAIICYEKMNTII